MAELDVGRALGQGTSNALATLQFQELAAQRKGRKAVKTAGRQAREEGAFSTDRIAQILEEGDFVQEAQSFRQLGAKTRLQKSQNILAELNNVAGAMDVVRKVAPLITNQEDYTNFRQGLIENKLAKPEFLPEKYDAQALLRIGQQAGAALKVLKMHMGGGVEQDFLVQGNTLAPFGKPRQPGQGGKPTVSSQKRSELIGLGYPESIATAIGFGTFKEARDVRGFPIIIDTLSGDEVGHMERDPATGKRRWVTNPAFKQPQGNTVPGGQATGQNADPLDPNNLRRFLLGNEPAQ